MTSPATELYREQTQRMRQLLDNAVIRDRVPLRFESPNRHANAWFTLGGRIVEANSYLRSSGIAQNYLSALQIYGSQHGLTDETLAEAYTIGLTAYVCVRTRARIVSALPLRVMTGKVAASVPTVADEWVAKSTRNLYEIETSLSIWGKNYLHKRRNFANRPVELEWVSPLFIQPEVNNYTGEITGYRLRYQNERLPTGDVIYTRTFNPNNKNDGVSPYEVAFKSINTEGNILQFAEAFFLNSARPDAFFTYDGNLDEEELRLKVAQINQFKGSENAHKTGILPSGEWEYIPISQPPKDLAMADLVQVVRENVIAVFELNPILVGLGDAGDPLSATNTYRAAWDQAIEFFAVPEGEAIVEDINSQWLTEFDDIYAESVRIEIDSDQINATSKASAERSNVAISLQNAGTVTINEARGFIGQKPDPNAIPRSSNPLADYQAGVIKLNEYRRHIGLEPVSVDGFIYEIDPRQQGASASPLLPFFNLPGTNTNSPFGLSAQSTKPLLLPATNPQRRNHEAAGIIKALVEARQKATVETVQNSQAEPVIVQHSHDKELEELRKWRQKQRKHEKRCEERNKPVSLAEFRTESIPSKIAVMIKRGLADGWHYGYVFDVAAEIIRAEKDVPEEPFGATPEEFGEYWKDFDDLQADIAIEWLKYMADVSRDLSEDLLANPSVNFDFASITAKYRQNLIDEWVGTIEAPGALLKVVLAGMANGNNILNKVSKPESPTRQGPPEALVEVSWDILNQEAYQFALDYAFSLITGIDTTTRDEIAALVQNAVEQGWTPDQLANELSKVMVNDPNTPPEYVANRARLISDTELARAYNAGAQERWQNAGVKFAQWQTVRDEFVCPVCRQLHGQTYDLNAGIFSKLLGKIVKHIAHPRCRCFQKPLPAATDFSRIDLNDVQVVVG